ncbi:hypothetical protein AVEN_22837-1 [Araneus ventricosus]|uniref:Uncharacterized protein n=1 Tax=Araneus ventricosus TaxID=182803 RepID=A0A4Y2LB53_ARAVE|nr:hypothetical protein AVEN_22837-1 [Araneus ventricosus]
MVVVGFRPVKTDPHPPHHPTRPKVPPQALARGRGTASECRWRGLGYVEDGGCTPARIMVVVGFRPVKTDPHPPHHPTRPKVPPQALARGRGTASECRWRGLGYVEDGGCTPARIMVGVGVKQRTGDPYAPRTSVESGFDSAILRSSQPSGNYGVYSGTPVGFRTLTTEPNPTPNPTGDTRIDPCAPTRSDDFGGIRIRPSILRSCQPSSNYDPSGAS